MLIGATNFFRDREAFDALESEVIPQFFSGKGPGEQVRVWIAACSTGEEAYSMAILLSGQESRLEKPPEIQVFAIDIDDESGRERGRSEAGVSSTIGEAGVS
jgi:two-component system, chemotaxis family, CheB/CheR fusion protein